MPSKNNKNNKNKNKNKHKKSPPPIVTGIDACFKQGDVTSVQLNKCLQTVACLPLVSICTPTFNRRPFIPFIKKCIEQQTYPLSRIEWIIIDDGTDPIGDLVANMDCVKYFYYPEKMLLGKKRNLMHSKCSGDIIVYMDDD